MVRNRSRLTTNHVAVGLVAAFVGLFVCWPVARLTIEATSLSSLSDVFGSARFRSVIWFTLWQAVLSTLATMLLGLSGAWLIGLHQFRGKRILTGLWSAPFVMPSVVVGAAFLALLPERWERSTPAILCAHIFFNVGMVTRVVGEAWADLDERFEQSAATLGASPSAQRWLSIRLLAPTIASIAGVVMSLCLTSFAIIQILGGPRRSTIESEIWRQATQRLALDRASVLAGTQVILVLSVLLWTSRRRTGAAPQVRTRQQRPSFIGIMTGLGLTIITVTPLLVLLARSLQWTGKRLSLGAYRALPNLSPGSGLVESGLHSIWTSLRAMFLATAIATVLVCFASLGRRRSTTHERLVGILTGLPMAVSGVTLGLGTLLAFAKAPVAWRSQWWMVPVLQAVIAFPFGVRVLRPAVDALDPRLRHVAETLGATPGQAWWRVDAALLRRSMIGAVGICAAVALGEFGATSFLVDSGRSETIPVAIGRLTGRPGSQLQAQAAALAVILAILTTTLTFSSLRPRKPDPRQGSQA